MSGAEMGRDLSIELQSREERHRGFRGMVGNLALD